MKTISVLEDMTYILREFNNVEVLGAEYDAIMDKATIHLANVSDVYKFNKVTVKERDNEYFPFEHYTYVEGVKIFSLGKEPF